MQAKRHREKNTKTTGNTAERRRERQQRARQQNREHAKPWPAVAPERDGERRSLLFLRHGNLRDHVVHVGLRHDPGAGVVERVLVHVEVGVRGLGLLVVLLRRWLKSLIQGPLAGDAHTQPA